MLSKFYTPLILLMLTGCANLKLPSPVVEASQPDSKPVAQQALDVAESGEIVRLDDQNYRVGNYYFAASGRECRVLIRMGDSREVVSCRETRGNWYIREGFGTVDQKRRYQVSVYPVGEQRASAGFAEITDDSDIPAIQPVFAVTRPVVKPKATREEYPLDDAPVEPVMMLDVPGNPQDEDPRDEEVLVATTEIDPEPAARTQAPRTSTGYTLPAEDLTRRELALDQQENRRLMETQQRRIEVLRYVAMHAEIDYSPEVAEAIPATQTLVGPF